MEIKEATEWLKSIDKKYIHGGDEGFDSKRHEAMRIAISALEKQDGKKPFYNGVNYECPYCNATIINGVKPWYCDICGQRIDWSE